MKTKIISLGKGNFNNIKIPQRFIDNPPKPEKLIHKMLVFNRESELKDILVDENMYLLDGYCSYLIAQQVGAEFVKIKMVRGGVDNGVST
jgi:hypothetical protein